MHFLYRLLAALLRDMVPPAVLCALGQARWADGKVDARGCWVAPGRAGGFRLGGGRKGSGFRFPQHYIERDHPTKILPPRRRNRTTRRDFGHTARETKPENNQNRTAVSPAPKNREEMTKTQAPDLSLFTMARPGRRRLIESERSIAHERAGPP